jgi:hypothetical protein
MVQVKDVQRSSKLGMDAKDAWFVRCCHRKFTLESSSALLYDVSDTGALS